MVVKENMKEHDSCIKEKLGTCRGCSIMEMAVMLMRWQAHTLESARESIAQDYCPVHPDDVGRYTNKEASYSMGQRRGENTIFDANRKPLRPRPRKGRPNTKMSKSKTGRFFVDSEPAYY